MHVVRALDYAAARDFPLTVRYAVLAHDLGKAGTPRRALPNHRAHEARSVRLGEQLSTRLRVPVDCRDAARLTTRWHGVVHAARELRPAMLLDLLTAADALRRPERLDTLLEACESDAMSLPGVAGDYAPARLLRAALAVVKAVDAAAIARKVRSGATAVAAGRDDAIARALRAARMKALREWRAGPVAKTLPAPRPGRRVTG